MGKWVRIGLAAGLAAMLGTGGAVLAQQGGDDTLRQTASALFGVIPDPPAEVQGRPVTSEEEAGKIAAFLRTLTGRQPAVEYPILPPSTASTPHPE